MGYYENVIRRAIRFIETNLKEDIRVGDIARGASYSQFHFTRVFMELTGETPGAYLRKRRLEKAASEILAGRDILEAAIDSGFSSQGTFTRSFKTHFRTTPGTYKKSGLDLRSSILNKLKEAEMSKKLEKSDGNIENRPTAHSRLELLDWIPVSRGEGHRLARGLETILDYLGDDTDYDTIMGDSGLAFIMQGEEDSINLINGAVDVGWWPLHPLAIIRLNFLEKTVGRELFDVCPITPGQEDHVSFYDQWFRPMVASSIAEYRPCLAWIVSSWFVITGYDDGEPPLIGECSVEGEVKIARIEDGWPSTLLAPGEPVQRIDRKEADLEALKYAIALHRDQVLGANVKYSGKYPLRDVEKLSKYWRTGLKSFASWIRCLQDMEHLGQHFWHSNVLLHLFLSRSSAIRYLQAMQKRHPRAVADYLENAIQKYKAVIGVLGSVDWSPEAMSSVKGREVFVTHVKEMADLESQAVAELEKAVEVLD